MSTPSEVSVYDRMCWPEAELERALASGAHRRELAAYLGGNEYAILCALAKRSERLRRKPPPAGGRLKVYLLPGILGTRLGRVRGPGQPPDLLWIDPTDIVAGRLIELSPAHDALAALQTLGAIVYSYLALKLRLSAAGFDVVLHGYDWRGDIATAGRELAGQLAQDPSAQLALVGHSMGALLARVALAQLGPSVNAERIVRVVGIGAPHGGSIAAVQALRASYPIVARLAAIDQRHDAQTLTRVAFRRFASVYQLLPERSGALDLYQASSWPRRGGRPDMALLRTARGFRAQLAPPDPRFCSIVGTGQRTVTGVARAGEQFRYQVTSAGDGTVATDCATLPGMRSYSLRCEHSELPRSEAVAAALIDLLRHGRTRRLRAGATVRPGRSSYVTDSALHRELGRPVDWQRLGIGKRRRYLNRLNEPPASYRARD